MGFTKKLHTFKFFNTPIHSALKIVVNLGVLNWNNSTFLLTPNTILINKFMGRLWINVEVYVVYTFHHKMRSLKHGK